MKQIRKKCRNFAAIGLRRFGPMTSMLRVNYKDGTGNVTYYMAMAINIKYLLNKQKIAKLRVTVSSKLIDLGEQIAKNVHDVWSLGRINEGWIYSPEHNDAEKKHPCFVPYEELSKPEKDYDRNTAQETLRLIMKLGFEITKY